MENLEFIKNVSIFAELEEKEIIKLVEIIQEVDFKQGEAIFKQGDTGDALYVIKKGTVEIVKNGMSVCNLEPGAFFGEMALVESKPRNADITANEDISLLKISKKDFNFFIRSNPTILLKIVSFMTERARVLARTDSKSDGDNSDAEEKKEANIITFFSAKGGVGKSLIISNMASLMAEMLHEQGKKILLWDMDFEFGCVDILLNIKHSATIYEFVESNLEDWNFEDLEPFLYNSDTMDNLSVFISPDSPEKSEVVNMQHVRNLLFCFKQHFDYIFIDLPSSFLDTTITALDNSDHIIFTLTKEIPTIRNSIRCLKLMKSLRYQDGTVKLLINDFGSTLNIETEKIEQKLENKVIATMADEKELVIKAVTKGTLVHKIDSSSSMVRTMKNIILKVSTDEDKEIIKASGQVQDEGSGFMDKLKNMFS